MPIQEKCRILDHQKVGTRYYKLILISPYISSHALPGQFVEVKCSDSYEPLLRRPISIHKISAEHKTFELLYEVVGQGTELLSQTAINEELDILGPLGQGFIIKPEKKIHILVGGGMGVAPLMGLGSRVAGHGSAVYLFMGARTKEQIVCEQDFRQVIDQVSIATDDGSHGKKGLISDLLLDFLENGLETRDSGLATIYACGPKAMLKAVAEIAGQKKIDCQLSLEERMACGIGACKGCAIKTTSGYKMVCKDGPVFDAKEIIWT